MPEVDRTKMLRVLAKGMGWEEWPSWEDLEGFHSLPDKPCFTINPASGELFVRREARDPEHWNPLTDASAAFELLRAMRVRKCKHPGEWEKFVAAVNSKLGLLFPGLSGFLLYLDPVMIAEAAYEALETGAK